MRGHLAATPLYVPPAKEAVDYGLVSRTIQHKSELRPHGDSVGTR